MAVTERDIESFRHFALGRIDDSDTDSTMGQLFDEWRLVHPSTDEQREIDVAIEQGLTDIKAGRGRPADEVMVELRAKHGLAGQ